MANQVFRLKRNDTSRPIKWYPRATPQSDFTGASVVFNMADASGSKKINRGPAYISSDTDGTFFAYEWTAADTSTADLFDAEFELTLADGDVETYPNDGYISVKILEDIA